MSLLWPGNVSVFPQDELENVTGERDVWVFIPGTCCLCEPTTDKMEINKENWQCQLYSFCFGFPYKSVLKTSGAQSGCLHLFFSDQTSLRKSV